ncbi:MAG: DUF1232 domain-containing protein [bacterium]
MEKRIGERLAERLRGRWRKLNEKVADRAAEGLSALFTDADEDEAQERIREFLEWMESAPNFMLLVLNLIGDERAPLDKKLQIAVILFYLLSPMDILPAWLLGPVGFMDEAMAAAYLVFLIIRWIAETDEDVILDNWPGEDRQLDEIMKVLEWVATLGGLGDVVERAGEPRWRKRLEEAT